jgi:hypothetical protein
LNLSTRKTNSAPQLQGHLLYKVFHVIIKQDRREILSPFCRKSPSLLSHCSCLCTLELIFSLWEDRSSAFSHLIPWQPISTSSME